MNRRHGKPQYARALIVGMLALVTSGCDYYWTPEPPIDRDSAMVHPNDAVALAGSRISLSCDRPVDYDTKYSMKDGQIRWDDWTLAQDQMSNDANFWPKWHVSGGTIIGRDVGVTSITVQVPDEVGSCTATFDDDDLPLPTDDPNDPNYGSRNDSPAMGLGTRSVAVVVPMVFEVGWPSHTMYDTNTWSDSNVALPFPQYGPNHDTAPVCLTMGTTAWIYEHCEVDRPLSQETTVVVKAEGTFSYDEQGATFATADTDAGTWHALIGLLPNQIYAYGVQQEWKYKVPAGSNNWINMNTTQIPLFLTYGPPAGSCVTTKRVGYVCSTANGLSEPNTIAEALFNSLDAEYNLDANMWGPVAVWLVHDGQESQCPGLALYVGSHFSMVGLGGWGYRFCYALSDNYFLDPNDPRVYGDATYSTDPYEFDVKRRISWVAGHQMPTTHDDYDLDEYLIMTDGDDRSNNYEATCFFGNRYYALGVGIFDTPIDVVSSAFKVEWYYADPNSSHPGSDLDGLRACDSRPYPAWKE